MADQIYISSKRTRDSTKATYKGRLKKLFEYLQRVDQGHLLLGAEGISLQDLETVHVMNFLGTLGAEAARRSRGGVVGEGDNICYAYQSLMNHVSALKFAFKEQRLELPQEMKRFVY